jgi:hypothetical protein
MSPSIDPSDDKNLNEQRQLVEAVRAACIRAALEGYHDAGLSGLCHEGAWEMAIDAMRALDIEAIIKEEFVTHRQ